MACSALPASPVKHDDWENDTSAENNFKDERNDYQQPHLEDVRFVMKGLRRGGHDIAISRAISQIRSIRAFQIDMILGRLRIELDTAQDSVKAAADKLRAATGYTFEQYDLPRGPTLDLVVDNATEFCQAQKPHGVIEIEPLERVLSSQKILRIHYNATEIGAREIVAFYDALRPSQNIRWVCALPQLSTTTDSKRYDNSRIIFIINSILVILVILFDFLPFEVFKNPLFTHTSLGLTCICQVLVLLEILPGIFRVLLHSKMLHMDIFLAISTTCACAVSLTSYISRLRGQPLQQGSYFALSSLCGFMVLLYRFVSEIYGHTAAKLVSFRHLRTAEVHLVTSRIANATPNTKIISLPLLQYGDHFVVPPNSRIATDGLVVSGGSEVNELMMNGESAPVAKGYGSVVYAGTLNKSGRLVVKLSTLPHENTISRIAAISESTILGKSKTQVLADCFVITLVPVIAFIGAAISVGWMIILRYHDHQSWMNAAARAVISSTLIIVMSCPYAIALAVPVVVRMASRISLQHGIVVRDTQKLQVARNVTDVVFSKNGVLTRGIPTVVKAEFHKECSNEITQILYGLFKDRQSPIALAMVEWLGIQEMDNQQTDVTDIIDIPGKGVEALCTKGTTKVRVGNPRWLGIDEVESEHTLVCVEVSGNHVATFRLIDHIRTTAAAVIKRLQNRGINVHLTSNDNASVTRAIAFAVGIPPSNTHHSFAPSIKRDFVQNLQKKRKVVMFVGDGTRDSVSLVQADIGVQVNHNLHIHSAHGSDNEINNHVDATLMNPSKLHAITILLDISASVNRRIQFNYFWAGVYNIVAIVLAACTPWYCTIAPQFLLLLCNPVIGIQPIMQAGFSLGMVNFGKRYREEEREALHETREEPAFQLYSDHP
ncbi:hypothetical protein DM02DRAFT_125640 [Periconia macrospinosa]|uniref:Heavy metal translocatin n=1 Tax=Periconia macrospinosa TaxID=97972 RepID=A0A2V1E6Z0_9PLEO|nr:hypothetical protein DM02DRAFT_125640 [Periconia macrospinosa]